MYKLLARFYWFLTSAPKSSQAKAYKEKKVKAVGERNEIEATFETGKRVYQANNMKAKLAETIDSWIAILYVNLVGIYREP